MLCAAWKSIITKSTHTRSETHFAFALNIRIRIRTFHACDAISCSSAVKVNTVGISSDTRSRFLRSLVRDFT